MLHALQIDVNFEMKLGFVLLLWLLSYFLIMNVEIF